MVDRKLGRGLDFFLSERGAQQAKAPPGQSEPAAAVEAVAPVTLPASVMARVGQGPELREVPAKELSPNPRQPRAAIEPEGLAELTESIKSSGVLQPILVRRVGTKLEIVAGERRWRAAQAAGLQTVPVVIRPITDEESAVFALVENLQRADLNAIEKARAFRQLLDQLRTTQDELGQRLGLDRSTIANFLRLLELAPHVQDHVSRGTLSMGHARALVAIKDKETQARVADEVVRRSLSVRALEERLRQATISAQAKTTAKKAKKVAWLKEIEESLGEALSTPVQVRYGRKASVIQITCAGRDEFERVFNRLKNC